LYGVINGIDYDIFNPAKDSYIYENYDIDSIEKKYVNKEKLQEELSLPKNKNIMVVGMISRLVEQKGVDIIAAAMEDMMDLNIQFVLLGTGDEKYEEIFKSFKEKYKEKASINIKFDPVLAQRIYAGCDLFLMPSKYEPCGLGQLISMRYGTVPLVRKTGGLADTVKDFKIKTKKGTGFVFSKYDPYEFLLTLKRAINVYKDRKTWIKLVKNVMKEDFSWNKSAKEYVRLYNKVLEKIK